MFEKLFIYFDNSKFYDYFCRQFPYRYKFKITQGFKLNNT